jgi:hypothetical protein
MSSVASGYQPDTSPATPDGPHRSVPFLEGVTSPVHPESDGSTRQPFSLNKESRYRATLLNNVLALLILAKAQIKRLEIEHHHNARITGVVIQFL